VELDLTAAEARPREAWRIALGFLTDTGSVREENEDALEVYVPGAGPRTAEAFFAVADGLGGHQGGGEAARLAVARSRRDFLDAPPEPAADLLPWIERLFRTVDGELRRAARGRGLARGMATTLTVAILRGDSLFIGHIGDTRCYRLRNGVLDLLTEDHTWVAEQRRAGLITEDEARGHADRHVLTRCLGIDEGLEIFVRRAPVAPGDRFLLASDGVHGLVDDDATARILAEEIDPQGAARRLLELADEAGGHDNQTAIVFDVLPLRPPDAPAKLLSEPILADVERIPWALVVGGLLVGAGIGSGIWSLAARNRPSSLDSMIPTASVAADSAAPATNTPRVAGSDSVRPASADRAASDSSE